MQITNRLVIDFCSIFIKSAIIRRAERNAVSPDVMGAAITPSMAKNPPIPPNQPSEIYCTMIAALPFTLSAFSVIPNADWPSGLKK